MEAWLKDFEIDTGKRKIKPYDPTVGAQIADMLRPSMGDQIPTDPEQIAGAFGRGLVEAGSAGGDRTAATRRLHQARRPVDDARRQAVHHSHRRRGRRRPVMTRAGSMIAQEWRQFGIDASTVVAQGTMNDRRGAGDFEAMIAWSVETWGGHPDLSYFLDSWHSQFVAKPGETQTAAQLAALVEP